MNMYIYHLLHRISVVLILKLAEISVITKDVYLFEGVLMRDLTAWNSKPCSYIIDGYLTEWGGEGVVNS